MLIPLLIAAIRRDSSASRSTRQQQPEKGMNSPLRGWKRCAEGNKGASAAISISPMHEAESPPYPSQLLTARKQSFQPQRKGDCYGGNANQTSRADTIIQRLSASSIVFGMTSMAITNRYVAVPFTMQAQPDYASSSSYLPSSRNPANLLYQLQAKPSPRNRHKRENSHFNLLFAVATCHNVTFLKLV